MKAVVTDGSTVVFGGKTYEAGDKFEIPEADAEVFVSAGHIISENEHKERLKAEKEAEKEQSSEAKS